MYRPDTPITEKDQDRFGFDRFAKRLADSLSLWKENESIVVALYGLWGTGKSSLINLVLHGIEASDKKQSTPTIIKFNPWQFSGNHNLESHFFNQLANELELNKDSEKDLKIAQKFRLYAKILDIMPDKVQGSSLLMDIGKILGILGIATSVDFAHIAAFPIFGKFLIVLCSIFFLVVGFSKAVLDKLADIFEIKNQLKERTINNVKKGLSKYLLARAKKLLIVIDDIDRLNVEEIRLIFKLVKCNSDLPNTLYLLAFDRNIIEKNLEEQKGVSGRDYLEKIVQVSFDVPHVSTEKRINLLLTGLDEILDSLPKAYSSSFDKDYWATIYHTGFYAFFTNVRNIKRYLNSLEFNIAFYNNRETIEVNTVDFFAIEAIRIFCPEFYTFMKSNKELFTSVRTYISAYGNDQGEKDNHLKEINDGYALILDEQLRSIVQKMITRMFPNMASVLGNTIYGAGSVSEWNRNLRICSTSHFDAYFTLMPGGNDKNITNADLMEFIGSSNNKEKLVSLFKHFIENGKIRQILERLQDYTDSFEYIKSSDTPIFAEALFDISDDISTEPKEFWGWGLDMDIIRIVYQLLKREKDELTRFNYLLTAVQNTKTALLGPLTYVNIETDKENKKADGDAELIFSDDHLSSLKEACINKIVRLKDDGTLKTHKHLRLALMLWKRWGNEEDVILYVNSITKADAELCGFMNHFIGKSRSTTDTAVQVTNYFLYKAFKEYFDLQSAYDRLKNVINQNPKLYKLDKETIDLYFEDWDQRESDFWGHKKPK